MLHLDSVDDFIGALPAEVSVADGLSALIRPCFVARPGYALCIADFAGIEARGVAWCADELHQLELFAAGEDNYLDLASTIFGSRVSRDDKRRRAVGKVAVLGCGYGMGADTFRLNCSKTGIDLASANTSAEAVVEAYRDRYPAIAGEKVSINGRTRRKGGLWRELEHAARTAITSRRTVIAGKCKFKREHSDLVVSLPSGRRMYYRNARLNSPAGRTTKIQILKLAAVARCSCSTAPPSRTSLPTVAN